MLPLSIYLNFFFCLELTVVLFLAPQAKLICFLIHIVKALNFPLRTTLAMIPHFYMLYVYFYLAFFWANFSYLVFWMIISPFLVHSNVQSDFFPKRLDFKKLFLTWRWPTRRCNQPEVSMAGGGVSGQSGEGHGSPASWQLSYLPPLIQFVGIFCHMQQKHFVVWGWGEAADRWVCVCLGHQVGPRAAHQVRFRVRLGGAFRERSEGSGGHTGQTSGSFQVRGGARGPQTILGGTHLRGAYVLITITAAAAS